MNKKITLFFFILLCLVFCSFLVTSVKAESAFVFNNDLRSSVTHPDVQQLQKFLNTHGFSVATAGFGSLGNETAIFGRLTKAALIKFQLANNIIPPVGYFGPITRGVINGILSSKEVTNIPPVVCKAGDLFNWVTGLRCGSGVSVTTKPVVKSGMIKHSSARDIIDFYILNNEGIKNGTDITVTVPFGTDVTSLVPTITISSKATISPLSEVAQDFTNPVIYTVMADNHSTKEYTVTVVFGPSYEKDILTFAIPSQVGDTVIDENALPHPTIQVTMPYGTDVTGLTPAITFSSLASINPASGVAQDFTNPITYIVTAEDESTKEYTAEVVVAPMAAGYKETFNLDQQTFKMSYVPGGLTFPTGFSDDGQATVNNAYWAGETEVTFKVWDEVYDWAVGNGYTFNYAGGEGAWYAGGWGVGGFSEPNQQPVANINWRNAIVWTNALTEYFNYVNSTNYSVVYKDEFGYPLRDSTINIDSVVPDDIADGFRLPSWNERQLAAKYIGKTIPAIEDLASEATTTTVGDDTYYWTPGDYVSGATSDYTHVYGVSDTVAWYDTYNYNPGDPQGYTPTSSANVATLLPNALGLYDMGGNQHELDFESYIDGGSWAGNPDEMITSRHVAFGKAASDVRVGFRVFKTLSE